MKISRHSKILELISKYHIDTQEDLANRLREDGYRVTQATISRDIKDLKLVKGTDKNGVYRYMQTKSQSNKDSEHNFNSILVNSVVSVECAMNIAVVKTHAGMAQAVGFVFDSLAFDEIIGCVAGDDTILCVTKTEKSAAYLADKIRLLLK